MDLKLKRDILYSFKLITRGLDQKCYVNHYHPLYIFATENITGMMSQLNLTDKSILLPCASSDQIFNFLLASPKKITAFDINLLTPYLFELKKAAIIQLTKEEYLDFFYSKKYSFNNKIFSLETYQKIRECIPNTERIYWDSIFQSFSTKELKKSDLFHEITLLKQEVININPYLAFDNYQRLKERLSNFQLQFIGEDVRNLPKILKEQYDFIYLSNIPTHCYGIRKDQIKWLKELLEKLKRSLTENGIIGVSYLYNYKDEFFIDSKEELYNWDKRTSSFQAPMFEYLEFADLFNQKNKNSKRLTRENTDAILIMNNLKK